MVNVVELLGKDLGNSQYQFMVMRAMSSWTRSSGRLVGRIQEMTVKLVQATRS